MRPIDSIKIDIVDAATAERLRAMTVTERVALTFEANARVRRLLAGYLRQANPDWNELAIQREIARRMLSDDDAELYR